MYLKTKKQTHRKRNQICSYHRWEEGVLDESSQKVQIPHYKVNKC